MGKMVKFDHLGAQVMLPRKTVISLWLNQVKPAEVSAVAGTLKIGQPCEGGHYMGAYLDDDGNERHLVLSDVEYESERYGAEGKDIEAKSLWNGEDNTKAMAEAGSKIAQRALDAGLHIPSVVESKLCFINGRKHFQKAWYLTSTQLDAHDAYGQHFDDGYQGTFSKGCKARVRLVRSSVL